MRLLILSDLHLEVWRERAPLIDPAVSQPDLVILAGDIENGTRAVSWAEQKFTGIPVLYVAGNHEAYGGTWETTLADLEQACADSPNVQFLNRGTTVVAGVRFLGVTLWTDFELYGAQQKEAAMLAAQPVMVDYRRIQVAQPFMHMMTPDDTILLHAGDRAWLQQQLAQPFDGRTVVITHMAPSMQSVAPRYADDLVSAAFASQLESIAAGADLWIHGHMHDSFDYRLGDCRVVCNPCGYVQRDGAAENENFNPDFVLELN
ncbi:metallophosphoesterase family protein [Herbaspirillum lusitanum]|uniref:Metallophosphoesterase family protein n=1 Tax=Herbaspirillum lusitanum TaxID=213312 RepID=A0ABW9AD86_9BURK